MGRRNEQRIAISLPVIVRGLDSRGSPFVVTTLTRDISCTGACLEGLSGAVEPGRKVEIECQSHKAWYRVQWVGGSGSPRAGLVGVRCLEPGKYIWGVAPKEWEADTYDPSNPEPVPPASAATASPNPPPAPWTGQERRHFVRHPCRIEAQVTPEGRSVRLSGTITDISLGGCYVEMLSPLPVKTLVELSLNAGDAILRVSGSVRVSQTGLGMGVVFTGMSPEDFEKLRRLAPSMGPSPIIAPRPARAPLAPSARRAQPDTPATQTVFRPDALPDFDSAEAPAVRETLAAVVRILFRKRLLTRDELLEELGKLKTTHT
jgi:hypothetical protein